jgi:hypothetical protein
MSHKKGHKRHIKHKEEQIFFYVPFVALFVAK